MEERPENRGQNRTVLNTHTHPALKNWDSLLHFPQLSEGQGLGTEPPVSPDSLLQWDLPSTSNLNALTCKIGTIERQTSSRGAVRKGRGTCLGLCHPGRNLLPSLALPMGLHSGAGQVGKQSVPLASWVHHRSEDTVAPGQMGAQAS